jgi:hypothetical protein
MAVHQSKEEEDKGYRDKFLKESIDKYLPQLIPGAAQEVSEESIAQVMGSMVNDLKNMDPKKMPYTTCKHGLMTMYLLAQWEPYKNLPLETTKDKREEICADIHKMFSMHLLSDPRFWKPMMDLANREQAYEKYLSKKTEIDLLFLTIKAIGIDPVVKMLVEGINYNFEEALPTHQMNEQPIDDEMPFNFDDELFNSYYWELQAVPHPGHREQLHWADSSTQVLPTCHIHTNAYNERLSSDFEPRVEREDEDWVYETHCVYCYVSARQQRNEGYRVQAVHKFDDPDYLTLAAQMNLQYKDGKWLIPTHQDTALIPVQQMNEKDDWDKPPPVQNRYESASYFQLLTGGNVNRRNDFKSWFSKQMEPTQQGHKLELQAGDYPYDWDNYPKTNAGTPHHGPGPETTPTHQSGTVAANPTASPPAPQPMNTTQRQEEQVVTNPSATEATITGTFGDNTAHEIPALTQSTSVAKPGSKDDPYPDQGMGQILSRVYEVDTITWSYNDATGDFIWSGYLPDLLLAIPNIIEKLDRFEFLRASCRLTFRLNGVIMHFGCLMLTYCPHYNSSSNVQRYFQTAYTASNLGAHLLSPNTNMTMDIEIPWVTPARYQRLEDVSSEPGFCGYVAAHVLAPLTLEGASSTPELKITVYAQFVLPEPAGLGLRVDTTQKRNILIKYKQYLKKKASEKRGTSKEDEDFEMLLDLLPSHQMSEQDTKSEKKTQSSKYAKKAKQQTESFLAPIAAEATEILGFLSEFKGALMDKPTDLAPVQKVLITPQSGLALADGLDQCEPLSLIPENKVAYDPIGQFGQKKDYNLFNNYKLRPSLIALGTWTASNNPGDRLLNLPLCPMAVHWYNTVVPGKDPKKDKDTTYVNFDMTNWANLAQFFKYWHGGTKFAFYIWASKFTSGRLTLKWLPNPTYNSAIANNVFGDVIFHQIDMTGDTVYTFTIPWLQNRFWERVPDIREVEIGNITAWDGINGQLVVEVSSPLTISNSGKTPIVYFGVFWSGAEDFVVQVPKQPPDYLDGSINGFRAKQTKHVEKDAKMKALEKKLDALIPTHQSNDCTKAVDVMLLFTDNVFPPMVPATMSAEKFVSMGETPESWTQLFRRFTLAKKETLSGASSYASKYDPFGDNLDDVWPLARALRAFHFKKGSFRVKALYKYGTATVEMSAGNNYANDSTDQDLYAIRGQTWTLTSIRPWIEFQIPFYYQYDMVCNSNYPNEHSVFPGAIIRMVNYTSSTTNFTGELWWYVSLGDDFSLGWPAAPVPLKYLVPPSTKKTA